MLISLLFYGCNCRRETHEPIDGKKRFPAFSGPANDGRDYNLKDIDSGVAVLGFLTSWCVPCYDELLSLQEIYEQFSSPGIEVVVFTYEDPSKFSALIDSLGVKIPIVHADSTLFDAAAIEAIPTRILLKDGYEELRMIGAPNYKEKDFRNAVRQALGLPETKSEDSTQN